MLGSKCGHLEIPSTGVPRFGDVKDQKNFQKQNTKIKLPTFNFASKNTKTKFKNLLPTNTIIL